MCARVECGNGVAGWHVSENVKINVCLGEWV